MALPELMDQLQNSDFAVQISAGLIWRWLYPAIETLHVIAIATVVGSILIVDLRILGLSGKHHRVTALTRQILPITWIAFGFALLTGSLLFIARAADYFVNFEFRMKMLLLLLAGVNMMVFHLGKYRSVHVWDAQIPPPALARIAAAVSIVLWVSIVFFGRWIGFTI